MTLLALFGAVTAILGIKEGSVRDGGAVMDTWIAAGWAWGQDMLDREPAAPEAAPVAAQPAPAAAPATAPAAAAATPAAPAAAPQS